MSTKEKTWWLQLAEEPEKLYKVRLIGRDEEFITLESAGRGMSNAWILMRKNFNIRWRTWKRMPTTKEMGRAWNGWK
jgi:hypothetical protein